jgi:hypothetical protein
MYGRREPPQEPPCHQCRVDLATENDLDATVYMMTRRQVVTAGADGHIVDISIPALKIVMDLLNVKDQVACLNRVRKLFHHFLEAQDEGQ